MGSVVAVLCGAFLWQSAHATNPFFLPTNGPVAMFRDAGTVERAA
jgi:hypothetical protein